MSRPRATRAGVRSARPNDAFGDRAKRDGYPARSVYKLEEIDQRNQLFRAGQRVLDLGAFPGSWTLYAAKRVGPTGHVLGVDLTPFVGALPPNAEIRQGDLRTLTAEHFTEGPFDVVLSDMAPATTGARGTDQYRSYELFMAALRVAEVRLRVGGAFVGKIFQGAEFEEARTAMRPLFEKVRVMKPEASRAESYEVFLVGLGRRAP